MLKKRMELLLRTIPRRWPGWWKDNSLTGLITALCEFILAKSDMWINTEPRIDTFLV